MIRRRAAPLRGQLGEALVHEPELVRRLVRAGVVAGCAAIAFVAGPRHALAQPAEWKRPPPVTSGVPAPLGSASEPEETDAEAAPAGPALYPPADDAQPALAEGHDRPRPSYAEAPPGPGDALLWVPRVALFPAYVVSEYVLRWPLVHAGAYAEEHRWPEHVVDFFTLGANGQAALWPVFFFDLGFRPRFGLYFSWDGAGSDANAVRAHAQTAGLDGFRVSVSDRYRLGHDESVELVALVAQQPDRAFWGFGPRSASGALRYAEARELVMAHVGASGWRSSELAAGLILERQRFDTASQALGGPSLEDAVASGRLAALPAGSAGFTMLEPELRVALDTRRPRLAHDPSDRDFVSPPGTGIRLAGHVRHAFAVDASRDASTAASWVDYGGVAAAYVDLTGTQRTLGLSLGADLVHPTSGGGAVPFTAQPALGGLEPMPGLRSRRLVGPSALAARIEYRWPIWVTLDGTADAALGNVFGPELSGFRPGLLRSSYAIGLRSIASQDTSFELLVGIGTRPLDEGASIEETRFVIGTSSSF